MNIWCIFTPYCYPKVSNTILNLYDIKCHLVWNQKLITILFTILTWVKIKLKLVISPILYLKWQAFVIHCNNIIQFTAVRKNNNQIFKKGVLLAICMQIFISQFFKGNLQYYIQVHVPIRNPKSTASKSSSTVHLSMTRTPRGGSLDCKSQHCNESEQFLLHIKLDN